MNRFRLALILSLAAPLIAQAADTSRYDIDKLSDQPCEKTLPVLDEGVAAGDRDALYAAGQFHDEGLCMARAPARSVQLWQKALEAGHPTVAGPLAMKLGLGEGVNQDYAAAGALVRQAGLQPAAEGSVDDYSLGYAYSWLQVLHKELQYTQQMQAAKVHGTAEVQFEPRSGSWKLAAYRRSAAADGPGVGSRVDRARPVVAQAVAQAAQAATAKLPKPQADRLGSATYGDRIVLEPNRSDSFGSPGGLGPTGTLINIGRSPLGS